MGAGRKFEKFSGETKWLGRNLLGDGKSDINLVSLRYTFVKHGPFSKEQVMKSILRSSLMTIIVMVLLLYFSFPARAYAYLDPGTGSFIIQMIIGGLLGLAVTIGLFWNRVKVWFMNIFSGESVPESEEDNEQEENHEGTTE